MNKVQQLSQMISNMGLRYFFYRTGFTLRKKAGLIKKQFPVEPPAIKAVSFEMWKQSHSSFFFSNAAEVIAPAVANMALAEQARAILDGKFTFFSGIQLDLGSQYDWVTNPDSGYQYDTNTHWIDINDYSKTSGDIKYVWEKSRFSFLYTLIRDEHHNKNSHGRFVFDQIESWIDQNPINSGPNYKCSQEISIRVFNWTFALYYYSDQDLLSEEQWQKIMNAIYWQMHHVYHNINFSRIAVRNNHAITESLALYLAGVLFPFMKDSQVWKIHGKKWFEEEVAYQLYEDGTFLQFSMNYHRVVIQLLTWAISISGRNGDRFNEVVYERAYRSLDFLFQCQAGHNGELPNYGANDGALFFPLNDCSFRDYRPQLNALHRLLCGTDLYASNGPWNEDAGWLAAGNSFAKTFPALERRSGIISFNKGGYYLIRDTHTFTFVRCGNHKDRPSQADNLHMDIWVNGENVLVDGGSYKYNTDEETLLYFMGTASHNTIMLNGANQMLKGPRFIWYYWTQCVEAALAETENEYIFTGTISAFRQLDKNIQHTRTIRKKKHTVEWIIEDTIIHKPTGVIMEQLWHTGVSVDRNSYMLISSDARGTLTATRSASWYSSRYGVKEANTQITFSSYQNKIITIFSLKQP